MNKYSEYEITLAELANALAHPARVRLLRLLITRGHKQVSDLVSDMPLSQPSVSRHLKILRQAGLVAVEPLGRDSVYSAQPVVLHRLVSMMSGLVAQLRMRGPR